MPYTREKQREKRLEYYQTHRELENAYAKQYYQEHRGELLAKKQRQRDAKRANSDGIKHYKPKPCKNCENIFTPLHSGSKYCEHCREDARQAIKLHIAQQWKAEHPQEVREYEKLYRKTHHDRLYEWYIKKYMPYRTIYEEHFKVKIPKGYHIHHIDGDHFNNEPQNLLCLTIAEHTKVHHSQGDINK